MPHWMTATLSALLLLISPDARPCTAYSVPSPSGRLLAKSFDWMTGDGWLVQNERGRIRVPLSNPQGSLQNAWSARYASLTLTTLGPGFPIGGLNEKGLALEALVDLEASRSRAPAPGILSHLELIQYALDRFATVAELDDYARATGFAQLAVPLHLLACDRSGDCAVLETDGEKVRIERNLARPALANRPFRDDLRDARRSDCGGSESSSDRFCRAAHAAPADPPAALAALQSVATPRTQWQLVWNLDRGSLLFRYPGGRSFEIQGDWDAGCAPGPRIRPLDRLDHAPQFWSVSDAIRSQALVGRQVRGDSPLPALVARATLGTACVAPR